MTHIRKRPSAANSIAIMPRAALGFAALLALPLVGVADERNDEGVALESLHGYRILRTRSDWTLYLKSNSLDIWRGNPPYQMLKTGHAMLALAWRLPVDLPGHSHPAYAKSAAISYVFSCSPPAESKLAKVTFYSTSFVPRSNTLIEQWNTMRSTVESIQEAQDPGEVSWRRVFDNRAKADWNHAWKELYEFACRRG